MEIISYGGGVQTAALLVLTAQGKVENPATHAVFSDTGSELRATYRHIEIMQDVFPIQVVRSDLGPLHEYVMAGNAVLPMYGDRGGMNFRICTEKWKIREVRRWLRANGAKQAIVQIGISVDEAHRMSDSPRQWISHRYPLVELRLSRQDCMNIIRGAGLPIPPRSACWMCPFRSLDEWRLMQDTDEFRKAVELEKTLEGLYLHASRIPLDKAVGKQYAMFQDDECGGYCWT